MYTYRYLQCVLSQAGIQENKIPSRLFAMTTAPKEILKLIF